MMFSYLFNTYESVSPPPKSKQNPYKEIYLDADNDILIIDLVGSNLVPKTSHIEEFQDKLPVLNTPEDFIPEETYRNLYSLSDNLLVNSIINTGRSFIGSKYTWGGKSPNTGLDCSGFISYIYKLNGIDLPQNTLGIFKAGKEVSIDNIRPGDIVCSRSSGPSGRHVQMVSRIDPYTNLIYVLEAKGRKYGIVESPLNRNNHNIVSIRRVINLNTKDPFLTNLDIQSPSTSTGRFSNKRDFIKALNAGYRRALSNRGLNPDYSYILTAQAALESGWGQHIAGKFNFSGIKISDKEAREHPERVNKALTTDWSRERGYFKHYLNFRNFSSIEDYCNYRINLLSNKRYNAFNSVSVDSPYNFVFHILSKGYGSDYGGPESRKYAATVMKNYSDILNILKT